MKFPSLFVSHGAPTLAIEDGPASRYLSGLGRELGRPTAILVVSAHWETVAPRVGTASSPETIHDFYGFPQALYQIRYPAPGAPDVAWKAADLLTFRAGLAVEEDGRRGLDHGAWVPLSLLYPEADIPVAQLSIQPHLGPDHHFRMGQALEPLRDDGVLIIASGSATHNLYEFHGRLPDGAPPAWVAAFSEWLADAVEGGRVEELLDYRNRAPEAVRNHPTDEHLLPIFVALGAGAGHPGRRLHASNSYGILAMDVYAFD